MAYSKDELRKMSPAVRELARVQEELQRFSRNLKDAIDELQALEPDSAAREKAREHPTVIDVARDPDL
ncbi:hypothetical protein LCGC14_2228300 [marine sediment metagenome]|uniref:Uncharacterized protein n=1 Tax=marine sediment metagenome TaxID=412755 RepID=A0A0F9D8Y2_9ZZZZ